MSSVTLAASLLFALGGLYVIDQSLARVDRAEARVQAVGSAAVLESFLTVHADALRSLGGLYLDTTRAARAQRFSDLVTSMSEYAGGFQRVWSIDTTGTVQDQYLIGEGAGLPPKLRTDSLNGLETKILLQQVRAEHRVKISGLGTQLTGEQGFVMLAPLFLNDQLTGFVGGILPAASVLRSVEKRRPQVRGRLMVIAGSDTLIEGVTLPAPTVTRDTAFADLRLPDGGTWRIAVIHAESDHAVRFLIWSVGLATLGALFVSLLHERRQGLRLAERSAELERLSSELLRANRAKSEFLANVSHELRTPLNAIVGFVDLLRDGVYGDLTMRQTGPVERIASSADHLRHLVDQILDLAKIAAGRLELYAEPIDLRPFVMDVASEVEALITERELNFSIAISASLPKVLTDPMHLRQILLNLIGNAVKFTPTGGIAVRARLVTREDDLSPLHRLITWAIPPGKPWIALQVSDTGIGISTADWARIFEEFEQVNAGPRGDSARRGTGLGLPISRRLARLLGGDISVESEPGKGSTFTIWLPVDPAALGTTPALPVSTTLVES